MSSDLKHVSIVEGVLVQFYRDGVSSAIQSHSPSGSSPIDKGMELYTL